MWHTPITAAFPPHSSVPRSPYSQASICSLTDYLCFKCVAGSIILPVPLTKVVCPEC